MEHFSEQAWADFARGFRSSTNVLGIQAHLVAGCLNCKSERTFWDRLQTMAQAESGFAPPQDLVRLVKLQIAAKEEAAPDKWTVASLLFNSYSQPLAVGTRGCSTASWQVVYEAEGLTIDLRLDREPKSTKISVVGQILDRRVPSESMGGAVIMLRTERSQPVAATMANKFGEFHLECEPQDHLQLTVVIGSRRLQIPIANLK